MNKTAIRYPLLCAVSLVLLAATSSHGLTARVDPAGGAPRIVVNGEPVRARMFWGSPGPGNLKISAEPQRMEYEFTAEESADTGTMHFRFGRTPGEIFVDDIRVTDLDATNDVVPRCDFESGPDSFARDWTFWPQGAANTVGTIDIVPKAGSDGSAALHVSLKKPADGTWPDFHIYHHPKLKIVAGHRYRASFWIRADPARSLTTAFYRPGKHFTFLGGPKNAFAGEIELAAKAGVNFVSFPTDLPWPKPGETVDWKNADASCQRVLDANPNALLVPRIPMDAPAWWREAYPDDVMQWENGRRDFAVPASPRYRHDAAERLAALVAHLEEKFGDHVAGYHPAGQNTGEWFYESSWLHPLNGYAPADLAAWRLWLAKKYANDDALRAAWHEPNVTLAAAAVPSPESRHAAPNGTFRDPVKERAIIDWGEFQQQAMADCVCDLAHAARTASGGKKLVLFFYGYVFELAGLHTGAPVSGHFALRRVLDCPDIDVLCAPISYFDRGLGGGAPSMTAAESVAMAGKMWLNEDDTHTYLATEEPPGWKDHVATIEDTNRELVRNVAQESLRNFGTWWMDLCASGWFNDERMWAEMARLKKLDDEMLKSPAPFCPEVALVNDERAMLRVAANSTPVTWPGVYEVRRALGRMGAPFGQYLMDDVLAGKIHARLFVFVNAWRLNADERAKLLRATFGATCIWCYAPGWFDGDQTSADAMRELTGFNLKEVTLAKEPVVPTATGKALGLTSVANAPRAAKPLFAAAGANESESLATYADGSPAIAMYNWNEGVSIFSGVPELSSELLRLAARREGLHLFTQTDCNVYANGKFIALHASNDGDIVIDTGRDGEIRDAMSGEKIGNGPRITIPMRRGDTRVLRQ